MLHLITILGARPQIIKAAALTRAIRTTFAKDFRETYLHTNQHYDENMSGAFFEELGIPQPTYSLTPYPGSHASQTASMLTGIEAILLAEQPDAVVVYGDTNSTLAGALVASKLHIPILHIEAGLRSFNKRMPEEINRILCDHVSTFLFTPTDAGATNLEHEGLARFTPAILDGQLKASADHPLVVRCGDVMFDNSLHFAALAEQQVSLGQQLQLQSGQFLLATVHRDSNTDVPERLSALFSALLEVIATTGLPIVLPLHPRTRKYLDANPELRARLSAEPRLHLLPPVRFLEMIWLEKHCRLVLTDSGGVQKEAYFFNKPCVILRAETEWLELVEGGAARLADVDQVRILSAVAHFLNHTPDFPPLFGDGKAAEFICSQLMAHLDT